MKHYLVLMALKLEPQTSVDKARFTETKKDKLAIDGNVDDAQYVYHIVGFNYVYYHHTGCYVNRQF